MWPGQYGDILIGIVTDQTTPLNEAPIIFLTFHTRWETSGSIKKQSAGGIRDWKWLLPPCMATVCYLFLNSYPDPVRPSGWHFDSAGVARHPDPGPVHPVSPILSVSVCGSRHRICLDRTRFPSPWLFIRFWRGCQIQNHLQITFYRRLFVVVVVISVFDFTQALGCRGQVLVLHELSYIGPLPHFLWLVHFNPKLPMPRLFFDQNEWIITSNRCKVCSYTVNPIECVNIMTIKSIKGN